MRVYVEATFPRRSASEFSGAYSENSRFSIGNVGVKLSVVLTTQIVHAVKTGLDARSKVYS